MGTGNNMTVKQLATKVATARTTCLTAFQQCRVSEREVGPAIQTCSSSSSTLLTSLGTLSTNNGSANGAKTKLKSLSTASGRHHRAVPTTCAGVATVAGTFTTKLEQNSAANVTSEYADINGVTLAAGSCTSIATTLNGYVTRLDVIISLIATEIATIQSQLESLTGSTATSAQITAAANTTATTASGRRRRASLHKLLKQVNLN